MGQHSAGWSCPVRDVLRLSAAGLAGVDPGATPGYRGKKSEGADSLLVGREVLGELQERLFAASVVGEATSSVLLVLQGMDSAGKGGVVRHVVGGVDPQGVELAAFKAPSAEERQHDFLWRIQKRLPRRGMIGVFDRSHYEDVLIGRVHQLASDDEIERRYRAIVDFEKRVIETGTRIVKVMLHISCDEQKVRLMERLERPEKHWKFTPADTDERQRWEDYMAAYDIAMAKTSTDVAPWYVVPANHKWYARLAVQELLLATLEDIDPQWPLADYDVEAEKKRLAAT